MTRIRVALGVVAAVVAVTFAAGCGRGANEPPATEAGAPAASAPAAPQAGESQGLSITFNSDPAPPRTGENAFDVTVMNPAEQPVTDADVSVEFYMAAMPEMKMPEMRNSIPLTHDANGRYRGTGNVMMGGRWDVTVMVKRGGKEIGSKKFVVTAK